MRFIDKIKELSLSSPFSKKYTLIFVPDITGKFFKFSVPRIVINGLIGIAVASLVSFALFAFTVVKQKSDLTELAKLREMNSDQKSEIERFSMKLKNIETQLARLEKFDRKLRVITALDDTLLSSSEDLATGGPLHNLNLDLDGADDSYAKLAIDVLNKDINIINNRAKAQEISFFELDEFLKEQGSLLAHTPSIWPVKGWLTSTFGYRISPFTGLRERHEGIDIATNLKTPIVAPAAGIVKKEGFYRGYGNLIEIDHGYGVTTIYGHNSANFVKVGQKLKRGDVIGLVGNTGRSTGPHTHYEVRLNNMPVDPLKYILED
ncbi:MAG: M23 family metallopeptidase [Nitrospinota bacterium]